MDTKTIIFENLTKFKICLFVAVLFSSVLVSINNTYALDGIEVPSSASTLNYGYVNYHCLTDFSNTSEGISYTIGSEGYVQLGQPMTCPNDNDANVVGIVYFRFDSIPDLGYGTYTHYLLNSSQDFEAYCFVGASACQTYVDSTMDLTLINYSHVIFNVNEGFTGLEATSTKYLSQAYYEDSLYKFIAQNEGVYSLDNIKFSSTNYIIFMPVGSSYSPTMKIWADDTELDVVLPEDEVPLNPVFTDPDFVNGNDIASNLNSFNFNLFNPFGLIAPLFIDEGSYCTNVLHEWLNIPSADRCIASPWPSSVRYAISIAGSILFSMYLFGFGVSWLRSTSAPFAKVADNYLGVK